MRTILSDSNQTTEAKEIRERLTFSLPHPTTHVQQNICPHSVTVLAVLSSKHNAHLLLARVSASKASTSRIVRSPQRSFPSSSPAEDAATKDEGTSVEIGVESIEIAIDFESDWVWGFDWVEAEFKEEDKCGATSACIRKIRRMPRRTPRREYDGGL